MSAAAGSIAAARSAARSGPASRSEPSALSAAAGSIAAARSAARSGPASRSEPSALSTAAGSAISGGAVFRSDSAWIDGAVTGPVDITCTAGVITDIAPAGAGPADEHLTGLVVPGFADAHSHVFHRGLRGRTHADGGTFWTWREAMYSLAGRLTPDTLHELAVAAYAEMVCAGVTAVGEFHYLHHQPGGAPYADPNQMGIAVASAAADAGIRLTLLDTAYLAGGFNQPMEPEQLRFSDGTAESWARRLSTLPEWVHHGVAIHSLRAVPVPDLPTIGHAANGGVLHVHLSEQPAENEAALAATGRTPTQLLADAGVLGPRTAAVHATHLTGRDISLLGESGTHVVICPATEADLADGLPAAGALTCAGAVLCAGSDQHVVTDPIAQLRGIEYGERLATGRRGTFSPADLFAMNEAGHRAIDAPGGRIAIGSPADLVALRTDSARTAGALPGQLLMAAGAADVGTVVIGGAVRARGGVHGTLGDPGTLLTRAIKKAWQE